MQRIVHIHAHSDRAGDIVRLDHDRRVRRRMTHVTERGERILLDMPDVVHLRHGDALELEDGRIVRVEAKAERLIEISAHNAAELLRLAWHLGNRHLPTQLLAGNNGGRMRIRYDHVIADMIEGLGGHWAEISAPFDPEGGAYGQGAVAGHSHGHGRHHAHDHHHEAQP